MAPGSPWIGKCYIHPQVGMQVDVMAFVFLFGGDATDVARGWPPAFSFSLFKSTNLGAIVSVSLLEARKLGSERQRNPSPRTRASVFEVHVMLPVLLLDDCKDV